MKTFEIKEHLKDQIQKVVDKLFRKAQLEVEVVIPPREEFGDYSTSTALSLAKQLKAKPEDIAEKIVQELGRIELVEKIEIAKPGYINFFLDYSIVFQLLVKEVEKVTKQPSKSSLYGKAKVIIEHTAVNPNKAMHIGHLRNSVLGDSLAKIYSFAGYDVVIENYIDDTGVQVAYLVLGITAIKKQLYKDYPKGTNYSKKDYYYWDIYAWIFNKLEEQKASAEIRKKARINLEEELDNIIDSLEEQTGEYYQLGKKIAYEMVNAHLETNSKFGIFYDILIWESSILSNQLWQRAFRLLKKNPKFILKKSGPNKGCWVLDYGSDRKDKVFLRSDGTALYVAKDFAHHLWKFGILKDPFQYFVWCTQKNKKKLFSTKDSQKVKNKLSFAGADQIINVIDETQSYTQKAIIDSLDYLGFKKQAQNYFHLAYGRVLLSGETIKSLGIKPAEICKAYPMSGRKGIGVKVDDLVDLVAREIFKKRKEETEFKINKKTAKDIAVAAIRYFMLKIRYDKELVFDTKAALQTTGNTGVYLQYSLVRALNILAKSGEDVKLKNLKFSDLGEQEKALINQITKFNSAIKETLKSNDPSTFAEYAYQLAAAFSSFYNSVPVLQAKKETRAQRLILVKIFSQVMEKFLELLGIPTLKRM